MEEGERSKDMEIEEKELEEERVVDDSKERIIFRRGI